MHPQHLLKHLIKSQINQIIVMNMHGSSGHTTNMCFAFKRKSIADRRYAVTNKHRLCYSCLQQHDFRHCSNEATSTTCDRKHFTIMHRTSDDIARMKTARQSAKASTHTSEVHTQHDLPLPHMSKRRLLLAQLFVLTTLTLSAAVHPHFLAVLTFKNMHEKVFLAYVI